MISPRLAYEPLRLETVEQFQFERFTGRGYATEMAGAAIEEARRHGCAEIVAGVDEVNAASLRVLEKLGFERTATLQGAFGHMLVCRLQV